MKQNLETVARETYYRCIFPVGYTYMRHETNPQRPNALYLAMQPNDVNRLQAALFSRNKNALTLVMPGAPDRDYTFENVNEVQPFYDNSAAPHLPRTNWFLTLPQEDFLTKLDKHTYVVNAQWDEDLIHRLLSVPDPFDDDDDE
jgi:hypothetical protein